MIYTKVLFKTDESVAFEPGAAFACVNAGTIGAFSVFVAFVGETFVDVFTFAVHICFVAIATNTFEAAGRVVAIV